MTRRTSGDAQARTYVLPHFPGVESLEVIGYFPDGQTFEIDMTQIQRPHPEVPCSAEERTEALRGLGWNTWGAWSKEGEDTWVVSVTRAKEPLGDMRQGASQ